MVSTSDKVARIWDSDTGAAVAECVGHQGRIHSARFSSGGRLVVTASDDKSARIWEVQSGKAIFVLKGHTGSVLDAVFSPDATVIATSARDDTIRLWSATTGEPVRMFKGAGAITFSRDGRLLAVSAAGRVRLWDVRTGDLHKEIGQPSASQFGTTTVLERDWQRAITFHERAATLWADGHG